MSFYVKLGPRGVCFRVGRMIVGVVGSIVYWRDARRRLRRHVAGPHVRLARPGRSTLVR